MNDETIERVAKELHRIGVAYVNCEHEHRAATFNELLGFTSGLCMSGGLTFAQEDAVFVIRMSLIDAKNYVYNRIIGL